MTVELKQAMATNSLMPRPSTHACERVQIIGLTSELKATTEIVKRCLLEQCGGERIMYCRVSQASSQNYGLVYAVCFQGHLATAVVLLIHT